MNGALLCAPPDILGSKNLGINWANYGMTNGKSNCDHEVSRSKIKHFLKKYLLRQSTAILKY